jgi:hypothetical protein
MWRYDAGMAAAASDLKSLPPQARKRIERLESTVSELTGALDQVVTEMQRQGFVIPLKKTSSPLLKSFLQHGKELKPAGKGPEQGRAELAKRADRERAGGRPRLGTTAALGRGEAAKVEWVRSGEVVPARTLADTWGLTPQALGPAAERGEVFAVVVKRQRYFPKEFLDLDRNDVSAVSKSLCRLGSEEKLIFWKRPHGALGGRTVFDVLSTKDGQQLARVVRLAQSWAAQADAAQTA